MRQEEAGGGSRRASRHEKERGPVVGWWCLVCIEMLLLEVLVPVWALWLFAGPCCLRRMHCPPFVFPLPLNEPPLVARQLRCAILKAGDFGTGSSSSDSPRARQTAKHACRAPIPTFQHIQSLSVAVAGRQIHQLIDH